MTAAPVRVLYLAGVGRSGSTLLELMIGTLPGFVAVGETVHVNDRAIAENQRCGCGEPFGDCPFWKDVGARAFGGWSTIDGTRMYELRRSVDRNRYIPRLLLPTGAYARRLAEYTDYLAALYRAVGDASGGAVVVDSSKHPSYAYLLRRVPGIDLRVLHLVRRPEGVAYSWAKAVRRPEVVERVEYMPRYGAARVALRWNAWNLAIGLLARLGVATERLRYEDLVRDPHDALRRVARLAGRDLDTGDLGFVDGRRVRPTPIHSVAGNPLRFERDELVLAPDDAWQRALTPARRRLVATLTAPLRWWYGYRGGSRYR